MGEFLLLLMVSPGKVLKQRFTIQIKENKESRETGLINSKEWAHNSDVFLHRRCKSFLDFGICDLLVIWLGSWAEQDVDPSLFPKELMTNASNFVGDVEVNNDPRILIGKAHAYTSSIGSATVMIAMLERDGILKIANVGDCGLRVIREGKIKFSTSPQEHYFDCPYQLSSEIVGQTYQDAMVSNVEMMEGDTIVMGSDGLFDNVFDHEIVSTVAGYRDVAEAAKALANLANNHSLDSNFDSPYSMEARSKGFEPPLWKKILGMKLTGGKPDDITVIVGQVVSL
ncbi:unnamed protein product [Malus baccata var. baccata]